LIRSGRVLDPAVAGTVALGRRSKKIVSSGICAALIHVWRSSAKTQPIAFNEAGCLVNGAGQA